MHNAHPRHPVLHCAYILLAHNRPRSPPPPPPYHPPPPAFPYPSLGLPPPLLPPLPSRQLVFPFPCSSTVFIFLRFLHLLAAPAPSRRLSHSLFPLVSFPLVLRLVTVDFQLVPSRLMLLLKLPPRSPCLSRARPPGRLRRPVHLPPSASPDLARI